MALNGVKLSDMVVSEICKNHSENKISIASLKQNDLKASSGLTRIFGVVRRLLQTLISLLRAPSCTSSMKHPMCENYGHVLSVNSNNEPICADCGVSIESRKQLRKAVSFYD